ncbi:sigma-70 family RNA polymerase sigma factor [Termitidicoccus mucosus]|uniref:RNA polymerase subunit sigma-24 n=1 Tax=Termitidicoccus mucosus TaxID=1184151 RepID=A0A178IJK7_9BACT|nr:RNA polymerase subunit sigma-24 [Opitutaceae bacterium TSB47]
MTPTRTDEDELLMVRIRADDEEALHCLLRKYYNVLCRYSYSLLQRRPLAEEAVSDVFLKLWDMRHSMTITSSVFHYLYRAVGNRSHDVREKNSGNLSLVPLDDAHPESLADESNANDPLLYAELQVAVEALLSRMPEKRQAIFRMNRLEGKRYKQIAAELNLSTHTVQRHMVLAMKQLSLELPKIKAMLGDISEAR